MTNNLSLTTNNHRKSFTLIELLVVLALVAILSVVVILTLNPAELIKQARDSNRLSDLSTINTALNLFSADVTGGFMGTSTVVYVSIPDNASSTCGSLGLPALPSGYTYNCVTTANLRNTNGTGWIPVNFQRISSNSPISQLPIDPQNTTSTKYYTYVTGGSWQLATKLESSKYQATAYAAGGADPSTYTIGNNLSLAPFVGGLVGWWKFDNSLNDDSGYAATSTVGGSFVFSAGKTGQAAIFDGSTNYLDVQNIDRGYNVNRNSDVTVLAWVKPVSTDGTTDIISVGRYGYCWNYGMINNAGKISSRFGNGDKYTTISHISNSQWNFIGIVYSAPAWEISYYHNSNFVEKQSTAWAKDTCSAGARIGSSMDAGGVYGEKFNGSIDDLRIYNRALSAAEISAIYNATK